MKIYTKTGDDGTTGLVGGMRVSKCGARIECTGAVDELNATIGLVVAGAGSPIASDVALSEALRLIQDELFVIGSHLATPADDVAAQRALPPLNAASVTRLEEQIDAADQELPPLRQFILPGGTELAARLHLARTICRRAERVIVQFLSGDADAPQLVVKYLNRLSDWLFVQARFANHRAGAADVPWRKM
ncbi:MAG: cob(I)yrinic acid a,c-diamide adenosyltransferase [Tepidisphaeraceae bacterium]